MEGKDFPTLPSAVDLCSCLIGQNWITWPPVTAREVGKVDHRIITIGLYQSQCIAGAGNIAAQKRKKKWSSFSEEEEGMGIGQVQCVCHVIQQRFIQVLWENQECSEILHRRGGSQGRLHGGGGF